MDIQSLERRRRASPASPPGSLVALAVTPALLAAATAGLRLELVAPSDGTAGVNGADVANALALGLAAALTCALVRLTCRDAGAGSRTGWLIAVLGGVTVALLPAAWSGRGAGEICAFAAIGAGLALWGWNARRAMASWPVMTLAMAGAALWRPALLTLAAPAVALIAARCAQRSSSGLAWMSVVLVGAGAWAAVYAVKYGGFGPWGRSLTAGDWVLAASLLVVAFGARQRRRRLAWSSGNPPGRRRRPRRGGVALAAVAVAAVATQVVVIAGGTDHAAPLGFGLPALVALTLTAVARSVPAPPGARPTSADVHVGPQVEAPDEDLVYVGS